MSDIQAALGLIQLNKLPDFVQRRKEIALGYNGAFADLGIELPQGEFDHVYYRYVLRAEKDVSEIISRIQEKGVMATRPVFKPLHRYLELRSGFKNTDRAYSTALSIPIYPSLTEEEQDKVKKAVSESL
jgi:perosamine synthetase